MASSGVSHRFLFQSELPLFLDLLVVLLGLVCPDDIQDSSSSKELINAGRGVQIDSLLGFSECFGGQLVGDRDFEGG